MNNSYPALISTEDQLYAELTRHDLTDEQEAKILDALDAIHYYKDLMDGGAA